MALPSRFLLALAAGALALASPAWAANSDAPGQVKKQDTTVVPTPQVQAPAAPTAPAVSAKPQAKTNGNVPVTKGTTHRLTHKQSTATTPSQSTTTLTRKARRRASRTVARHTTTRTHTRAAARRRHTTPRGAHARRARGAGSTGTGQPSPVKPVKHPVAHHATHNPKHAATVIHAKKTSDPAPLVSISHAADRVVEVIPGVVILALAALTMLVLLLMVRSVAIERRRSQALAKSYGVTVEALATAIEAKDHTTGGHIERVRRLGLLLAGEMVARDARDPQMAYGFLLHDIGKLAVPDAILRAPGRLTEDEWAQMRRHPEEGVRMLAGVPFLDKALDVVRYHHERWDGGGYPAGLRGEEIPLWARIFSVVDALDAITAERPYRAARSYESALEEIRRHSGTQFDPAVVEALERLDPAQVMPLLEPAQQLDQELAELAPLEPLVAA